MGAQKSPIGCFLLRTDNIQNPFFHYSNNELFKKKSEGRKKLKIKKDKKKKENVELE